MNTYYTVTHFQLDFKCLPPQWPLSKPFISCTVCINVMFEYKPATYNQSSDICYGDIDMGIYQFG